MVPSTRGMRHVPGIHVSIVEILLNLWLLCLSLHRNALDGLFSFLASSILDLTFISYV